MHCEFKAFLAFLVQWGTSGISTRAPTLLNIQMRHTKQMINCPYNIAEKFKLCMCVCVVQQISVMLHQSINLHHWNAVTYRKQTSYSDRQTGSDRLQEH